MTTENITPAIQQRSGISGAITKASGYWSTKLLAERYCCSTRTIWRWTARDTLPFPQPKIRCSGSQSLWSKDDVLRWEEQMDAANQSTTEAA